MSAMTVFDYLVLGIIGFSILVAQHFAVFFFQLLQQQLASVVTRLAISQPKQEQQSQRNESEHDGIKHRAGIIPHPYSYIDLTAY